MIAAAFSAVRTRALGQPKVVRSPDGFTDAHGPNLRMLEWSLPDDASIDDMPAVKAVNPAARRYLLARLLRCYHCGTAAARALS